MSVKSVFLRIFWSSGRERAIFFMFSLFFLPQKNPRLCISSSYCSPCRSWRSSIASRPWDRPGGSSGPPFSGRRSVWGTWSGASEDCGTWTYSSICWSKLHSKLLSSSRCFQRAARGDQTRFIGLVPGKRALDIKRQDNRLWWRSGRVQRHLVAKKTYLSPYRRPPAPPNYHQRISVTMLFVSSPFKIITKLWCLAVFARHC